MWWRLKQQAAFSVVGCVLIPEIQFYLQTFGCFGCLFNSHHIEKDTYYPPFSYSFEQGVRQESSFGMSGSESNPASLFCLYVNYGRFVEATNLLLEYIESLASLVCFKILCCKFQNIQVSMKFLIVLAKTLLRTHENVGFGFLYTIY